MLRERLTWLRGMHLGADALVLVVTLVAVAFLRARVGAWWPYDVVPETVVLQNVSVADQLGLGWMLVPLWLAVFAWRGRYGPILMGAGHNRLLPLLTGSVLAVVAFFASVYLLRVDSVSRTVVVGFAIAAVPALWASYRATRWLTRRIRPSVRMALVGDADALLAFKTQLSDHPEWGVVVVSEHGRVTAGVVQDVDQVVAVGGLRPNALSELAGMCEDRGVALSVEANFLGTSIAKASVRELGTTALLTFSSTPTRSVELALKRVVDVVGAGLLLLLLWPVCVVIALAIRLQDGGPALFVQERVGRYGRRFPMVKFRTMRAGAEAELDALRGQNDLTGPAFKLANDPRITRVGWWLRRLSLDELPQLLNVLRGDMSLVGPRPPLAHEVASYGPGQQRRLSMRPGLTGLWQVTARDEPDVSRWIALDLHYIDHWTLLGDLGLLVRTVPAVIHGRGAR